MGGTLTVWLAENHPEIAGIVAINAAVAPQAPEIVEMVKGMVDEGQTLMPGIGSDIAKPGVIESAYDGTPLKPLLSLIDAAEGVSERLGDVTCAVLIMTSPNDHVVDPTASDLLAEKVSGPVERVSLERSFHVATVDYDAELIQERAVEFGKKVTAYAQPQTEKPLIASPISFTPMMRLPPPPSRRSSPRGTRGCLTSRSASRA